MKIIIILYLKKCADIYAGISQKNVGFLRELLDAAQDDKKLAALALQILKIICYKRKNCQYICNGNFTESLYRTFQTTGKCALTVSVLKLMTLNCYSLEKISKSSKIFHLIFHLIASKDIKPQIQKVLMTVLYRITGTEEGLRAMSSEEYWNTLLHYFLLTDDRCRMTKIKAFTILNRSIPKKSLPCDPDYYRPEFGENIRLEMQNYYQCSENTESDDNDESDDDEGDEDFKGDSDSYDSGEEYSSSTEEAEDEVPQFTNQTLKFSKTDTKDQFNALFQELLEESSSNETDNNNGLKIYEKLNREIKQNPEHFQSTADIYDYLFSQIVKHTFTKGVAYPDKFLAEAEPSDKNQTILVSTNKVLMKNLANKLCRLKFEDSKMYPTVYFVEQEPQKDAFSSVTLPLIDKHCLKFSSTFEGGNLRFAERVGQYEYNLMVTGDYKTENFSQWFYFSVTNMESGKPYTFNIINFKRINSQFNHGMQPVLFSVKDFERKGVGWQRAGKNIVYYGNNFTWKNNNSKQYRTLSFSITFNNAGDTCFIAYHYPYTYTRLLVNIFLNCQTVDDAIYARVDKLCDTIQSNEVPLITVTNKAPAAELLKRPIVFITGRVHPGESNSSWIMQGIINFLLNDHQEKAVQARSNYIFKIVPMLNPEGVILGQARNGITGEDLNRCYKTPNPVLHPEIDALKSMVEFAVKVLGHPIAAFVDIHGHSRKKYFFLYGCDPKQSWNKLDRKRFDSSESCTLIPTYISNENLNRSFCRYDFSREKESTCRVVMWREFGIKCSYTLESSYCSGENKKKMTTDTLQDIGVSLITALAYVGQQKIWQKKRILY